MKLKANLVAARIERLRAATGKDIPYKLGKGGHRVNDGIDDIINGSDCSGLLAHSLPLNRDFAKTGKVSRFGFRWIETSNLYNDATGNQKLFKEVTEPMEGAIILYPDANGRHGHVATITKVTGTDEGIRLTGVDCSSGSFRRTGDSIIERDISWMMRHPQAIYAVPIWEIEED